MTLRRRLVVAFAYLLVLTVVALAIPLGISVDRRAKDAFYNRLSTQAQEIASSLGGSAIPGGTRQHLGNVVAKDGGQTDARVIVTDGSDRARLLADSDDNDARPPRVAYNTAGRPEIAAALEGRSVRLIRHSVDLGGDLLVVASPVLADRQVVGTVRLSQPMAAVDARVRRSWEAIAAVAAVVAIVGLAVAWGLATSLARPLHSLAGTAERLAAGRPLGPRRGRGAARRRGGRRRAEPHGGGADGRSRRPARVRRERVAPDANAAHRAPAPARGARGRPAARSRGGARAARGRPDERPRGRPPGARPGRRPAPLGVVLRPRGAGPRCGRPLAPGCRGSRADLRVRRAGERRSLSEPIPPTSPSCSTT